MPKIMNVIPMPDHEPQLKYDTNETKMFNINPLLDMLRLLL